MHRTAYLVGKRRVLNCPFCAKEQDGIKRKIVKITRSQFNALCIDKVTDENPLPCSNCCEPINIR